MPESKQGNTNPSPPPAKPKLSFMKAWWLQYYKPVTAVFCLLFLGTGYMFLLSPKIDKVRTVADTVLAAEQDKEAALKKRIEYLVALEERRRRISAADIERLGGMLPSEPAVPELLASLESIAKESAVSLESIQLSKLAMAAPGRAAVAGSGLPGGVQAMEIQLTVAGTVYSNVKALVANIEKSLRLLDVTALLYTPAAKAYNLTVRSYYLP